MRAPSDPLASFRSGKFPDRTRRAYCMVNLPRPATWKFRHPDNPSTQEVTNWWEAVQAHAEGYRYQDSAAVSYGIHAVTWVGGTALCYSHGYFAAKRELEKK